MKYFKQYKDGSEAREITKEEARQTLDGHWKPEVLDDIFDNEKGFRLWTPFSIVWTKTENGLVPIGGFYGVVGDYHSALTSRKATGAKRRNALRGVSR